jgi:hypothetical protein
MNNLLFSALTIALIYYFFFYLPTQKTNANLSFKHQATQTEREVENKEVQTEKDEPVFSTEQISFFTEE